jgi:hypothetical protein
MERVRPFMTSWMDGIINAMARPVNKWAFARSVLAWSNLPCWYSSAL